MDNRFKSRIIRMFGLSFGSCRNRNKSDIIEKAVFLSQNHTNIQITDSSKPKTRLFPSVFRPTLPKPLNLETEYYSTPRRKISEKYSPLFHISSHKTKTHRRISCPPGSPITPLNPNCKKSESSQYSFSEKNKKKKKKKSKGGYINSEDNETQTLVSSRSFSSRSGRKTQRKTENAGLELKGTKARKVKQSFVMVKRSSDPYNDFKLSMVEMIMEKELFCGKDLEKLLQCFLSLNSHHYHSLIVQVFVDIYEALFFT